MSLLTNLVSYWKLDEASGDALDANGSNTLTDNNSVGTASGKLNTSRQFTAASSQTLSRTDVASLSTGDIDFTIAAWVYLDSTPGSIMGIATKGNNVNGAAGNYEWALVWNDGGLNRFDFEISDGSNSTSVSSGTFGSPTTGTWYFVVGYHDSVNNQIGVSVNGGVADTTSWTTGCWDSSYDFCIGEAFGSSRYWNGRIDEVGFWKRVLTADERTQLYNASLGLSYSRFNVVPPTGGLLSSLLSYWKLDESSGAALDSHYIHDLADNGGVGTASGKISTARSYTRSSTQYSSAPTFAPLDSSGDRAVSCWIYVNSFAANSGNYTGLVTWGKTTDVVWSLSLVNGTSNQNKLRLEVQNSGGTYQSVDYGTLLSTSTWYHIVAELNSGNLNLYVNGSGPTSISFTGSIKTTGNGYSFALGRDFYDSSAARFFDGNIDEVALWSRGLTGTEVTQLYNSGSGLAYPFGATLEQYRYRWRYDDGSESAATALAAENTNISRAARLAARLRVGVNATGDPAAQAVKLQFRKVGDPTWEDLGN